MTKEEEITLKLIALTQDKKIKWSKYKLGTGIRFEAKIHDTIFQLFYFDKGSKDLSLQYLDKIIIPIISKPYAHQSLLKDLFKAITYDERTANLLTRNKELEKAYNTIINYD